MFLGSQSCASAMCHGGADEKHDELLIWSRKDFHTRAPATLTMARSARIAESLKISDATKDARCTTCHNPFQAVPAAFKDAKISPVEGVSCETCHNAAPSWLLSHTRSDLAYTNKVSAGMRDLKNLYVRANTCVACHQNLAPDLRAAGHPELIFELDGQSAAMPRHWSETNRLRGAQAWFVGQLAALREAEVQLNHGNASAEVRARAAALRWVTGVTSNQNVDALAMAAAGQTWTRDDVLAQGRRLLATHDSFAKPDAALEQLAHRAERVVLGLDRVLVALNSQTDPSLSPRLDALLKAVQSRPDFQPQAFATHLSALASAFEASAGAASK